MDNNQYPYPYVEKPGQAHYNLHQKQQQFDTQQAVYSQPQNPYSTQQTQTYPRPYQEQPQMVYVQPRPPQQSSSANENCLACACLTACCWATFCWPCICCL